jgi:shikimate dehydrogenase
MDADTQLYCVIGNPVSHSLSPVMHNKAFENTGVKGVYLAFNVTDLDSAVKGIRSLGIKGISVTIPHKVSIMDFLDEIDETAAKIGAVNTVVNRNGKLSGYNTDCLGAVNALLEKTEIRDQKVLMIGAGGAARAVGYGILSEGGKLTIANILKDEGEKLAKDLDVSYYPLSDFNKLDYHILINTTPVGMAPEIDAMPVPSESLKKNKVVMDIIYSPLKTKLLKEAEKLDCKAVDGVSMFVFQGAAQFEMWTKKQAPAGLMRDTVLDALQGDV